MTNLILPESDGMKLTAGKIKRDLAEVAQEENNPCSWCNHKDKRFELHFHGSDFGKCKRAVQYAMMNRDSQNPIDREKALFFYDGHLHEAGIIRDLRKKGYFLDYTHNTIEREKIVSKKVGFGGIMFDLTLILHPDAIAVGISPGPTWKKEDHILIECKAVKDYAFKKYKEEGYIPPTYFGQVQAYLYGFELQRGFLIVKNRTTADSVVLKVDRDEEFINKKVNTLTSILYAIDHSKIVKRDYDDPKEFECRYCPFNEKCWEGKK